MAKKLPVSFSNRPDLTKASSDKPEKAPKLHNKKGKVFQSAFAARVYAVVAKIPKGKTMTYKQVAEKADSPRAARAVGMIMMHNYNPKIPCHRVIRSDGKSCGYNRGGPSRKMELLRKEGFDI